LPSSFSKILSSLPTKAYRGVVHRHIPEGGDAVASSFSRSAGGRWNPPGEFGALYTTTGEDDIEREMERAAEKRGITPQDLLPRDIVTISVSLQKVLDLTNPAILRAPTLHSSTLTVLVKTAPSRPRSPAPQVPPRISRCNAPSVDACGRFTTIHGQKNAEDTMGDPCLSRRISR
jgi:RES domain-containing protein